jgi:hypothetical protein
VALIFCNVENRPFDEGSFESGPHNLTIHVTGAPHTLDGWGAHRGDGGWVVSRPQVVHSEMVRVNRAE